MQIRKSWSYYFFTVLSAMGLVWLFSHGLDTLEEGSACPRLAQGALLLGLFGAWGLLSLAARAGVRLRLDEKLSGNKRWVRWTEALIAGAVLLLAALVRLWAVQGSPETYLQEYKSYYEIALALEDNAMRDYGGGYGGSVAAAPTLMGYGSVLLLAFRIFGPGVRAGQYMNVVLGTASVFFAYRIARKAGGRIAGLAALLLSAFWPSAAAAAILSPQCTLVFFALGCIWLFLSLAMDHDGETERGVAAVLGHILLGALLGVSAAVSAQAVVLTAAFLLFLLPRKMKLPAKPVNDIPLAVRALKWGWVRCIMLLIPYLIVTGVFASNIEMTVDRDIPAWTVALGSELWTDTDAAGEAGAAEALAERYLTLTESGDQVMDRYASLLEEGSFTREQSDALSRASRAEGALFLGAVFFALIGLYFLLSGEGSAAFILAVIFAAAAASYVAGADQGAVLAGWMIPLLGAMACGALFSRQRRRGRDTVSEHSAHAMETAMDRYEQQMQKQEEERLVALRKEAYANVFDMDKALREGHVTVSVSEAYAKGKTVSARDDGAAAAQRRPDR